MIRLVWTSGTLQAFQLWFELLDRRREIGQTFLLLLDHLRRGARDETLVGEFGVGLDDLPFEAGDLLGQALGFSGDVDLDLEHQARFADDGDRRVGILGHDLDDLYVGQFCQ